MIGFIGPGNFDPHKCRVIYLAFGEPYLAMALNSIRTLRDHNPMVPTTIVTNVIAGKPTSFLSENDDWIEVEDRTENNRDIKTRIDTFTDAEFNLYLDSDTEIRAPLDSFFGFLNCFDLGFSLVERSMHGDAQKGDARVFPEQIPVGELPHWNGGIFLFRKNAETRNFFLTWNQRFKEMKIPFDQPSLVEAIFESRARLISFDYRWNAPYSNTVNPNLGRHVKILHYATALDRAIISRILNAAKDAGNFDEEMITECRNFLKARSLDRTRRGKQATIGKRIRRWLNPIR